MRRGHRKRLIAPRPGALATRGRSVCARSVNPTRPGRTDANKRLVFREGRSAKSLQNTRGTRQRAQWLALRRDIWSGVMELNGDTEGAFLETPFQADMEDCSILLDDQQRLRDAMFAANLVGAIVSEPLSMMIYRVDQAASPQGYDSRITLLLRCTQPTPLRWQVALSLADVVAREYARNVPRAACRIPVAAPEHIKGLAALQEKFLSQHGRKILSSLATALQAPITLRPAPLAPTVSDRFIEASMSSWDKIRPTLHGTDAANHESIFARGLMIPGASNGLRVRHGTAHGAGVYTSTLENAWLSRSFCTEPRLLVCGVIDDAAPLAQPQLIGRLMMTSESSTVRHVGGAIVVLDEGRVLPLFEASSSGFAGSGQISAGARAPTASTAPRKQYHAQSHFLRSQPGPDHGACERPWGAREISRCMRATARSLEKTPRPPRGGLRRAVQKHIL